MVSKSLTCLLYCTLCSHLLQQSTFLVTHFDYTYIAYFSHCCAFTFVVCSKRAEQSPTWNKDKLNLNSQVSIGYKTDLFFLFLDVLYQSLLAFAQLDPLNLTQCTVGYCCKAVHKQLYIRSQFTNFYSPPSSLLVTYNNIIFK